jgi:hypothetical protein
MVGDDEDTDSIVIRGGSGGCSGSASSVSNVPAGTRGAERMETEWRDRSGISVQSIQFTVLLQKPRGNTEPGT